MPSISTSNTSDAIARQVALSRSRLAALHQATPLSASIRPSVGTTPASQPAETGASAAFAQAKEFQKTAETAKSTSDFASRSVYSAVGTAKELLLLALNNSSAEGRNAINEQLSKVKTELGSQIRSFEIEGKNALYQSAGTGSNSENSAQATALVSDDNAENGALTKSYSGTTEGGSSYSYHFLSSAASSSSSEISVSATTSREELQGMIAALDSMKNGTASVTANLDGVAGNAYESSNKALEEVRKQTSLPVTDLGRADRQSLADLAVRTRDQLIATRLPIANVNALNLLR